MSGLERFLVYNLGASLVAGLVAWAAVWLALRLLRARSAFLHASFLLLPLLKSLLVLAGLDRILPWRMPWLVEIQQRALPPAEVLPWLAGWLALSGSLYALISWQQHWRIRLGGRVPQGEDQRRLTAALAQVADAYRQAPCCETGESVCCLSERVPLNATLLVSDDLRSPAALIENGAPAVIFPRGLVTELNADELALALAHELNHFAMRRPAWRVTGGLRVLALVSPVAFLLADYFRREEEKACDDLAVLILGQPETYAGMLVKCYQFGRARPAGWLRPLPLLPQLLGLKPFFSQRVERLLQPRRSVTCAAEHPAITWFAWILLVSGLFFTRF